MLTIRKAGRSDINGIMVVEEMFGSSMRASKEVMLQRIDKCAKNGWFLVAVKEDRIVGYVVMQPTHVTPGQCDSWETATDNGSLNKTFNESGKNIYIVSLATDESIPGATELLAHATFIQWLETRKVAFMFCSRMPGFAEAHTKDDVSADDYWQQKRADGSPQDWMLHLYWKMTGVQPFRLLLNGFKPDSESGGHGVLFILTNPYIAIKTITPLIYHAGFIAGARTKGKEIEEQ